MHGGGITIGTDGWVESMIRKPDEIPFQWAAKYPRLEKALVAHYLKTGKSSDGFPELRDGAYLWFEKEGTCVRVHTYSRFASSVLMFFLERTYVLTASTYMVQMTRLQDLQKFTRGTKGEQ